MNVRCWCLAFCLTLLAAALGVESHLDGAELTLGSRTLVVPDGFEVEVAAGPPLVDRPIAVSRDELGRLYVTDSAGMSDKADKQLELKPHRIVRLEDVDGDGKYDKSVVFADRMMFPEGCLWHEGSLYVAAPPQIWKLTDTDGDGKADKREVWHDGKTLTGCANDLHGPYLGPDGWLYFCKGAFAEQTHTLPNGKAFTTRAGHIFRARPDGTGLEPVMTGGMDNPVNVAFHSTGERFLSCTFFQFPEAGKRDGLLHAIYGGVYGKKHESIYAHKMTGDVMPVMVHQGAAAPCGLVCAPESLFGGGHFDNLFACYFNLHKVVRHELIPKGATFTTKDSDFVTCEHPDFHPTDVFPDADGSLLVVDTGGWYKVCCPTSQLAKPDVLGAIYRVRKKDQPKLDDALGLKLDWTDAGLGPIAGRLADPRPMVQQRAMSSLRQSGRMGVGAIRDVAMKHRLASVRRRAVWTLASIDAPTASELVRAALQDPDESVRLAAIQVCSLNRDTAVLEFVLRFVDSTSPRVARAAAETLGRIAGSDYKPAVDTIMLALDRTKPQTSDAAGAPVDASDRILEHSLIYALIEIGNRRVTLTALDSGPVPVRRAALVALDQMDQGQLEARQVLPMLNHSSAALRSTAAWVVSHHSEWGPELVDYFRDRLARPGAGDKDDTELVAQLGQLAKSPAIQELLSATLREPPSAASARTAMKAMAEARLPATPAIWLDDLTQALLKTADANISIAIGTARSLPLPKSGHPAFKAALLKLGTAEGLPLEMRLSALTAAGGVGEIKSELFKELAAHCLPEEPYDIRTSATSILATAALTADQREELLKTLKTVGPLELPRLLAAYEREPTEPQGLHLAAALESASGFKSLRPDQLVPLFAKYPKPAQDAAARLVAILNAAAAEQAAFLQQVLTELPAGDVRRGHEVFVGKKAACIACHAVGYLGGRLGPDLTNISKVRTDRDLVESIVFPSASFVRSYEPVIAELEDGRLVTGIITKETAEEVVISTGPQQSQPIARRDIAELHPSKVSLMPQGFATQLSRQDLADLLAYLKAPR
jgi:putative membrane-bound dehydrogenase-like protein